MLETETKRFEDLEFQQLERESRQDEEKETHTQQLLREVADNQRSTVTRKVPAMRLCSHSQNETVARGRVPFMFVQPERFRLTLKQKPCLLFSSVESVLKWL